MPDLATAEQRGQVFDLFTELGCKGIEQMRADAMVILGLEYLPDLRELTQIDADYLIAKLRRDLAAKRVNND